MYTAEKPWAGCRHVQIIHQVTSLNAKPMFPEGTPTPFQVNFCFAGSLPPTPCHIPCADWSNLPQELANQCMHPDKNERPTFEKISDIVEDLIVTFDWSQQGLAPPSQTASAKPSCLPEQHQLSAVLLQAQ